MDPITHTRVHEQLLELKMKHAEKIAEMIDQEERLDAVAKPVEALDRRQSGVEPGRCLGVGSIGVRRVVIRSQQKGPGRDAPVLIGRQGGHPQGFQGGGNAIRAHRAKKVGDDQVFGQVLEPLQAIGDVLVEEPAKPQVQGVNDGFHEPSLERQERYGAAGTESQVRAPPFDGQAQAITVIGEIGFAAHDG